MSDTVLHDTNLDFSVSIIAVDRKGDATTTPIDAGAITHLEVRDDLVNFGLTGTLSYKNIFQIVDRIGITKDSDRTLYILCNIKDRDLNRPEDVISFLGLLEKSATDGGNIVDVNQTFLFEEATTSRLKKMSVLHFRPRTTGRIPELISSILDVTNTPYDFESFNTTGRSTTSLISFLEPIDSAYKVITNLYNSLMLPSRSIPLIKVEGDLVEDRKLVLKELLTARHIEFINTYMSSGEGDFSDVYQEEFTISPEDSDSINSSIHNKVEKYDILKPDISNLRQTIWGSYKLDTTDNGVDLSLFVTNLIYYQDFVTEFETFLGGIPSNLPKIENQNAKIFQINSLNSLNSTVIAEDTAFNRVFKSFVLRNETIVLKVKGKIYRKPGKFISIKGSLSNRKVPQTELWLVIDVKHKFIKGNYTNEIVATRILGNEFFTAVESDDLYNFTGGDFSANSTNSWVPIDRLTQENQQRLNEQVDELNRRPPVNTDDEEPSLLPPLFPEDEWPPLDAVPIPDGPFTDTNPTQTST